MPAVTVKTKFWKLKVYVGQKDGSVKDEICVELETTTWELDEVEGNKVWHRKEFSPTNLHYEVCHFNSETDEIEEVTGPSGVEVKDGKISFSNQHFLKIRGLILPGEPKPRESRTKMPWIEIIDPITKQVTELLTGRNVHVEIRFEATPQIEKLPVKMPLFHLEQGPIINEKKYVLSFGEVHTGSVSHEITEGIFKTENIRQVYWEISGHQEVNTGSFRLCDPSEYTLVINQDYDRFFPNSASKPPYFEFLADTVPLPMASGDKRNDTTEEHEFTPGEERVLYIGFDPITKATFEGSIRSIILDPNSSCDACN